MKSIEIAPAVQAHMVTLEVLKEVSIDGKQIQLVRIKDPIEGNFGHPPMKVVCRVFHLQGLRAADESEAKLFLEMIPEAERPESVQIVGDQTYPPSKSFYILGTSKQFENGKVPWDELDDWDKRNGGWQSDWFNRLYNDRLGKIVWTWGRAYYARHDQFLAVVNTK